MQEVLSAGFGHRPLRAQEAQLHYCLTCRMAFGKGSALAVHAFKKHGRANKVRRFVVGTQCENCLRVYDRYTDLVNHVKDSVSCYHFYRSRNCLVERQPGVNSRQENKNRAALRLPVLQAEGPQCLPAVETVDAAQAEQDELAQAWTDASSLATDADDWLEKLWVATLSTCLYHEEILSCFQIGAFVMSIASSLTS